MLAVAIVTTTAGVDLYGYLQDGDRETRVRYSFVYAAAGVAVVALGVLVEIL